MANFSETPEPNPEERKRRRGLAWWWFALAALAVGAIAFVLLSGGGDDDGQPADASSADSTAAATSAASVSEATSEPIATSDAGVSPTIEGIWEFIVNVTDASGACEGEEAEEPSVDNVSIRRRDDGGYAVTGLGSTPDDEWQGGWDGDRFVFHGERDEDDGVTVAEFTMAFDETGALVGVEEWTWSDNDGDCPDGRSEVEAYYDGPLS